MKFQLIFVAINLDSAGFSFSVTTVMRSMGIHHFEPDFKLLINLSELAFSSENLQSNPWQRPRIMAKQH